MIDLSSHRSANDEILARFAQALENSRNPESVLEEFCARHSELADELRELASVMSRMNSSRVGQEPAPPERLGDFRIVRRIGRGGMGEIYEAVQDRLDRRVAVKTIRQGCISEETRERFLREQRVLACLHQTHIVPIHTAGEEGELQYFAMPYIEGAALHHVVRVASQLETVRAGNKTPSLAELAGMVAADNQGAKVAAGQPPSAKPDGAPPPETSRRGTAPLSLSMEYFRSVARVMADAAEALHHAHEAGVLHRDIKPSNIMVDTQGHCWLVDFGLARMVARQRARASEPPIADPADTPGNGRTLINRSPTSDIGASAGSPSSSATHRDPTVLTTHLVGTPHYMAPESFNGQTDVRSDVWGLGATLYELLTLERPFPGVNYEEVQAQILTRDPAPLPPRAQNLPTDLAGVCRKALHKHPDLRYATALELAEDLRRWLRLEPTQARPALAPRRAWLWVRRNPGWAAALAMGSAAVLAVIIGSGIVLVERAERREMEANAAAKEANDEILATQAKDRERQQQLALLQMQQLRSGNRLMGWSTKAWGLARQIKELGFGEGRHTRAELQAQAAATLQGLDAVVVKHKKWRTSAMVWDAAGKRILAGGTADAFGKPVEEARIWDPEADIEITSGLAGEGPVAFRPDGTALQLVPIDAWTLRLWDVERHGRVRDLALHPAVPPDPLSGLNYPVMALSPDGSMAAASTTLPNSHEILRVWELARSSNRSRSKPVPWPLPPVANFWRLAMRRDGLLSGQCRQA